MQQGEKIKALSILGSYLENNPDYIDAVAIKAKAENPWFTLESVSKSLDNIVSNFLGTASMQH